MKACSWPGCKVDDLEDWRWGCGKHWNLLPLDIRQAINDREVGAEWDAVVWVRVTFQGQDKKPWNSGRWETLKRFVAMRDEARARRRAAVVS